MSNSKWLSRAAVTSVCVTLSVIAPRAAGKPGATDTALSVAVRSLTSDGVKGDGAGYVNGQANVKAVLVANDNGNFVLDTNDNTKVDGGRRLRLNFAGQQGQYVTAPLSTNIDLDVDVFFGTLAGGLADFGDLRSLLVNQSLTRRGPISWTDGERQYNLRWNGQTSSDGQFTAGLLRFTCTSDNGAACTAWTVAPTTPVAVLDSTPTKGSSTQTVYGYFSMPFELYLTKR
jgi:hypothetical protein